MRRAESADGTLKIYGIEVDSKANDIESLEVSHDDIATIYNLNGHRINSLQRGINIIRMNDGKVRKVVVKQRTYFRLANDTLRQRKRYI